MTTTTLVRAGSAQHHLRRLAPRNAPDGSDHADAYDYTARSLDDAIRSDCCSICDGPLTTADRRWLLYTPEDVWPVVVYPDVPLPGGLVLPAGFDAICVGCRAAQVTP